jgi:hypothetical protein
MNQNNTRLLIFFTIWYDVENEDGVEVILEVKPKKSQDISDTNNSTKEVDKFNEDLDCSNLIASIRKLERSVEELK